MPAPGVASATPADPGAGVGTEVEAGAGAEGVAGGAEEESNLLFALTFFFPLYNQSTSTSRSNEFGM